MNIEYHHKLPSKDYPGEADIVTISKNGKFVAIDVKDLNGVEATKAIIKAIQDVEKQLIGAV